MCVHVHVWACVARGGHPVFSSIALYIVLEIELPVESALDALARQLVTSTQDALVFSFLVQPRSCRFWGLN